MLWVLFTANPVLHKWLRKENQRVVFATRHGVLVNEHDKNEADGVAQHLGGMSVLRNLGMQDVYRNEKIVLIGGKFEYGFPVKPGRHQIYVNRDGVLSMYKNDDADFSHYMEVVEAK